MRILSLMTILWLAVSPSAPLWAQAEPGAAQSVCDPPVAVDKIRWGTQVDEEASRRLKSLYEADQAARQKVPLDFSQDAPRRREVVDLLRQGKVVTPDDLYHAAMVFQHGNCPDHFLLANRMAEKAMQSGHRAARWLYAASWDRYLMNTGKPQKFGTQYRKIGSEWELYPVDLATMDEERQQYNVPPLADAQARVEKLNAQEKTRRDR